MLMSMRFVGKTIRRAQSRETKTCTSTLSPRIRLVVVVVDVVVVVVVLVVVFVVVVVVAVVWPAVYSSRRSRGYFARSAHQPLEQ